MRHSLESRTRVESITNRGCHVAGPRGERAEPLDTCRELTGQECPEHAGSGLK